MNKFKGLYTALVTPFKDGEVDYESLGRLVEDQLAHGVDGFVVNGTTAESPCLTEDEQHKLLDFVKSKTSLPVIFGSGSNCTATAIEQTKKAHQWGADAALVVVPYYNKPNQEGMYQHFKAVAEACPEIPIMLYNVPSRTVVSISAETVIRLAKIDNIFGIKEASGKMDITKALVEALSPEFVISSGDDATFHKLMQNGGHGVVSVGSHLWPAEFKRIIQLCNNKQNEEADALLNSLLGKIESIYVEPNPVPVKHVLSNRKILSTNEVRLPLVSLSEENQKILDAWSL